MNEFLEKVGELQPLLQAIRARAVTVVNPFRCKPIHKKAIFAVLTDDDAAAPLHRAGARRPSRPTSPGRGACARGARRARAAPSTSSSIARAHRHELVLKPNDEYGGKGVFIGWEASETEWEEALATALRSSYVVQEKVDLQRESFPELSPALGFRDLIVDLDPFVFQGEVEGFLTRLSGTSLANVTSGGGQVPAFLVEPR